jgi:hypothetical protein
VKEHRTIEYYERKFEKSIPWAIGSNSRCLYYMVEQWFQTTPVKKTPLEHLEARKTNKYIVVIYIMNTIPNPNRPAVSLYDSLRIGYLPENKKGAEMAKYGYQIDKGLSNDNQQVYYNPESKKLLYNVTGSQSLNDWVNVDAKLALGGTIGKGIKAIGKPLERGIEALLPSSWKNKFERGYENIVGGFKDTDRYKQADETLKKAKAKYSPAERQSRVIRWADGLYRTSQRSRTRYLP